jgi:hypothetical protein
MGAKCPEETLICMTVLVAGKGDQYEPARKLICHLIRDGER